MNHVTFFYLFLYSCRKCGKHIPEIGSGSQLTNPPLYYYLCIFNIDTKKKKNTHRHAHTLSRTLAISLSAVHTWLISLHPARLSLSALQSPLTPQARSRWDRRPAQTHRQHLPPNHLKRHAPMPKPRRHRVSQPFGIKEFFSDFFSNTEKKDKNCIESDWGTGRRIVPQLIFLSKYIFPVMEKLNSVAGRVSTAYQKKEPPNPLPAP